jgi:hypothetical protein
LERPRSDAHGASAEFERLAGPGLLYGLHAFLDQGAPAANVAVEHGKLSRDVTTGDDELEAALTDQIDYRCVLRDAQRIVEREDERANPNPEM